MYILHTDGQQVQHTCTTNRGLFGKINTVQTVHTLTVARFRLGIRSMVDLVVLKVDVLPRHVRNPHGVGDVKTPHDVMGEVKSTRLDL